LWGFVLLGRYQVYADVDGKFRFRLRAANNKILVVSEAYESKSSCFNGVESVQKNCQAPVEDSTVTGGEKLQNPKYQLFADAKLKFRFNLIAANGQVIASSEGYNSKQGCLKGIEAVKNSCGAEVEDLTVHQVAKKTAKKVEQCAGNEDTGIAMLAPPNFVKLGAMVTFEGWIINSETGEGIEGATVNVWESDRSFMSDDVLASGVTKKDGSFNILWKATRQDWWDDSVEVYSKFDGKENCKPTRSANYKIRVL
jgi:uncharacterized protein YegP (UPF0339 family)